LGGPPGRPAARPSQRWVHRATPEVFTTISLAGRVFR
jgi:hypothetical protein